MPEPTLQEQLSEVDKQAADLRALQNADDFEPTSAEGQKVTSDYDKLVEQRGVLKNQVEQHEAAVQSQQEYATQANNEFANYCQENNITGEEQAALREKISEASKQQGMPPITQIRTFIETHAKTADDKPPAADATADKKAKDKPVGDGDAPPPDTSGDLIGTGDPTMDAHTKDFADNLLLHKPDDIINNNSPRGIGMFNDEDIFTGAAALIHLANAEPEQPPTVDIA